MKALIDIDKMMLSVVECEHGLTAQTAWAAASEWPSAKHSDNFVIGVWWLMIYGTDDENQE